MKLRILPLTSDLWSPLEDLFGKNGACNGCRCMYWRIGSEYKKRSRDQNRRNFQKLVKKNRLPVNLHSMEKKRLAGVSLHHEAICHGLIVRGALNVWTMFRSGRSVVFK